MCKWNAPGGLVSCVGDGIVYLNFAEIQPWLKDCWQEVNYKEVVSKSDTKSFALFPPYEVLQIYKYITLP